MPIEKLVQENSQDYVKPGADVIVSDSEAGLSSVELFSMDLNAQPRNLTRTSVVTSDWGDYRAFPAAPIAQ
jgi:hypothetical protein